MSGILKHGVVYVTFCTVPCPWFKIIEVLKCDHMTEVAHSSFLTVAVQSDKLIASAITMTAIWINSAGCMP